MFRKDAESVAEWSMGNVDVCWQRQRGIVADVWECLKPGGLFVYSTCTYNTWEDEENIRWMVRQLGAEPLPVPEEEPESEAEPPVLPPAATAEEENST